MVADLCPGGGPYVIVISGGGQRGVTERKLDYHGPGPVLSSSVIVKSNTAVGGNRTVILTRPLKGFSSNHFSFVPSISSIPIITARGCGLDFVQHCAHGSSELNFLAVNTPRGVCQGGISGTIGGVKFHKENSCAHFPTGDLEAQKNPTCSIETYRGGLSCCRDGHSLLDSAQEVPWGDQYLEYHLKVRFYFEEYHMPRLQTHVPQCPPTRPWFASTGKPRLSLANMILCNARMARRPPNVSKSLPPDGKYRT
jgi:hypothetical protein